MLFTKKGLRTIEVTLDFDLGDNVKDQDLEDLLRMVLTGRARENQRSRLAAEKAEKDKRNESWAQSKVDDLLEEHKNLEVGKRVILDEQHSYYPSADDVDFSCWETLGKVLKERSKGLFYVEFRRGEGYKVAYLIRVAEEDVK